MIKNKKMLLLCFICAGAINAMQRAVVEVLKKKPTFTEASALLLEAQHDLKSA